MELSVDDVLKVGAMVVTGVVSIALLKYQVKENNKKIEALEKEIQEKVELVKNEATEQFKETVKQMVEASQQTATLQMEAVKQMVGAFTDAFKDISNLGAEMRESVSRVHDRVDEAFEEFRKFQVEQTKDFVSDKLCTERRCRVQKKD